MDLATFRLRFPEFALASDAYVQAYLDSASLRLSPTVFGTLYAEAVAYCAADLMANTPAGQSAKLMSADGTTTYGVMLTALKRACCMGYRVV